MVIPLLYLSRLRGRTAREAYLVGAFVESEQATGPSLPSPASGGGKEKLRRSRQRAVDHIHRVLDAVGGGEGAEARATLLAKQHLIEHVEPVERDAGLAVLAFFLRVEERLAAADLVDHILDGFRRRVGRQLRQRIAQVDQRRAPGLARLAKFFRRLHEIP